MRRSFRDRAGRRVAVVTVACITALALGSCSFTFGEPNDASGGSATPSPPAGADALSPEAAAISAPGRLAVLGADGSLSTVRANGSGTHELVGEEDDNLTALQPAWSPQGDRLAWVVQQTRESGISGAIAVSDPRGNDVVLVPTPFLPYYLSWSPTGDRVAFLGAGGQPDAPIEMGVLDLTRTPARARAVAGGDPFFYFAWAPDGRRVIAHTGFDRLEELDLSGRATQVSASPGLFVTPAWSADGRTLVYAERAPDGAQQLVAVVEDRPPRVLVEGRGALSFVLRPDGGAVAYQLLDEDDGDFFDRRATEPGDGVRVVDVRTGATRRATSIRAMTYWWSPDGERLLTLAPEPESAGAIPFLWQIWDGGRAEQAKGLHSPTIEVLRDYAPFFTQYAQSATPWAPDGSAYAFPVAGPDGTGQIVVQEVGGEPVPVAEGVYVTWSP